MDGEEYSGPLAIGGACVDVCEGSRVSGLTKDERDAAIHTKEICQVCRNSYTEFRTANPHRPKASSNKYEGWVQNSVYDSSG